jgi:hypothetical protein
MPTTYKILPNIPLSRLTPYAEEIIGDHQCGFWCNRLITDQLFYIRQKLEKKWEYEGCLKSIRPWIFPRTVVMLGRRHYAQWKETA